MKLQLLDWVIVLGSLLLCFVPALFFGKRAGKSTSEFFVSGRSVPWWLAGLSMVATTFSSDTPNLVTDIVRRNGGLDRIHLAFYRDRGATGLDRDELHVQRIARRVLRPQALRAGACDGPRVHRHSPFLPVKFGARFSMKAFTPSA